MFPEHVDDILREIPAGSLGTRAEAFAAIRKLGLEDFGNVLWKMPTAKYPELSKKLPPMAGDEITKRWTGSSGVVLLQQSVSFVRACSDNYTALTNQTLRDKMILDFGCGYGRFLRLFTFYSDHVLGVDAWEKSIDLCRAAGFEDRVKKSDEVPNEIPFSSPFDFMFAFSIFTHLSEKSAVASLKALRAACKPGGILCVTIRPVEYWEFAANGSLSSMKDIARSKIGEHKTNGFAYIPHRIPGKDPAEVHYGDTSMTLEWLLARAPGWEFETMDRSINDSLQRYVFLRAV